MSGKYASSSHSKGSSSSGSKHGGSSGSGSKTYTAVWYCNNCHYGPNNINLDDFCPNCEHQRCRHCTVTTILVSSRR